MADMRKTSTLSERYVEVMNKTAPEFAEDMGHLWEMFAPMVTESMVSRIELTYDERMDWVQSSPSAVEVTNFISPAKGRLLLADAWSAHSTDVSIWHSLTDLWERGVFDSVTATHVVLHSIPVEIDHRIPLKVEVDPASPYSGIGRADFTSDQLSGLQWGTKEGNACAVRGKISGIPFVKVCDGGAYFLRGPWDIPVPESFPVEKCEYYGGLFYVVFPYAVASFKYEGNKFVEHPWCHPMDFVSKHMFEGIMVLFVDSLSPGGGLERRAKYLPTSEVYRNVKGHFQVWEAFIDSKSALGYVRPRPGKPATSKYPILTTSLTGSQVRKLFPFKRDYGVIEIRSGLIERNMSVRGHVPTLRIDSGLRVDSSTGIPCSPVFLKIPQVSGIQSQEPDNGLLLVTKSTGQQTYSPTVCHTEKEVPLKSYVGSKLVILSSDRVYLIRDNTSLPVKPLDWVGGQRNRNETPLACLLREIQEESTVELPSAVPYFVGCSDSLEKSVFSRSHVFICDALSFSDLSAFVSFPYDTILSATHCQPWVSRIASYLIDTFGSLYDTYRAYTHLVKGYPLGVAGAKLLAYVTGHAHSWKRSPPSITPCGEKILALLGKSSLWKNDLIRALIRLDYSPLLATDTVDYMFRLQKIKGDMYDDCLWVSLS